MASKSHIKSSIFIVAWPLWTTSFLPYREPLVNHAHPQVEYRSGNFRRLATTHRHRRMFSDNSNHPKSPFDTLVIPNRTRYPSSKTPVAETAESCLVKTLLAQEHPTQWNGVASVASWPDVRGARRMFSRARMLSCSSNLDGSFDNPFDAPFDSQRNSRKTSITASGRSTTSCALTNSISSGSSNKDALDPIDMYNSLAAQFGLTKLKSSDKPNFKVDGQAKKSTPLAQAKGWLSKIMRSPSKNTKVKDAKVERKPSVSSFPGQPKNGNAFRLYSLDDICRLGGTSVMYLPHDYCVRPLTVPTCLAATGNNLIENGRDAPGVFRIPGQRTVVNTIYNHCTSLLENIHPECSDQIEQTIGPSALPSGMSANTHDVASAFKRFVGDMPGGILGSVALFHALREIYTLERNDIADSEELDEAKAKLIATATIGLTSAPRAALISAVFGMLAFLKQDDEVMPEIPTQRQLRSEKMSSAAFGVVFAPILLGDLLDEVDVLPTTDCSNAQKCTSSNKPALNNPKMMTALSPEVMASLEKTNTCASLVEMLVRIWEKVVRHMTMLDDANPPFGIAVMERS